MDIIYTISSALSSSHFKIALGIFIFIVSVSFYLLSFTGKDKVNKSIGKLERMREYNPGEYQDIDYNTNPTARQYTNFAKKYIRKNNSLYQSLLNSFGIDEEKIRKDLIKGDITSVNAEQVATIRISGFIIGAFLTVTLLLLLGLTGALVGFVVMGAFNFGPDVLIKNEIGKRKEKILKELSVTIRLLSDVTNVGRSIEDAIIIVSKKNPNVLSDEFIKVQEEAKVTSDWLKALENMDERLGILEVTNLISEIKISRIRGISITDVLLSYAKKIDQESTIRITEKGRKKSTTLLMPIFLFLFGPLLLMILLPVLTLVLGAL